MVLWVLLFYFPREKLKIRRQKDTEGRECAEWFRSQGHSDEEEELCPPCAIC